MLGGSRGELGIPIVLAEEDDRKLPDGGEIQRLVERSLCHRPVTEERDGHTAVAPELGRRRRPGRNRQAGGHDAVGAEDPELGVGDVHGAAAAAIRALVLAHQLGEHPGRVQTLGQAVTMTAMGRGDDVRGTQGPAGSDGRRLLPGGEMDEAGDLAVAVERRHALLEAADHEHAALHLGQIDHGIPGGRGGTVGHQTCTVLVGTT